MNTFIREIMLVLVESIDVNGYLKIDEEEITGIFIDLDRDGNLLLKQDKNIFKITTADVA